MNAENVWKFVLKDKRVDVEGPRSEKTTRKGVHVIRRKNLAPEFKPSEPQGSELAVLIYGLNYVL